MKVYRVQCCSDEFRVSPWDGSLSRETTEAHIAGSLAKAVLWCRQNRTYGGTPGVYAYYPWYWRILKDEIDGEETDKLIAELHSDGSLKKFYSTKKQGTKMSENCENKCEKCQCHDEEDDMEDLWNDEDEERLSDDEEEQVRDVLNLVDEEQFLDDDDRDALVEHYADERLMIGNIWKHYSSIVATAKDRAIWNSTINLIVAHIGAMQPSETLNALQVIVENCRFK